ncbi:MAG TPA: hypothetical protein VMT35_01320 [Ignavibacteriaceae bacterium]|nr:hypothetical protein [Ignavibacteriaceae bacterium]
MDIIDNLIYATYVSPLQQGFPAVLPPNPQPNPLNRIVSDYLPAFPPPVMPTAAGGSYTLAEKINFCAYNDSIVLVRSTLRHFYDIDARSNYDTGGLTPQGGAINGTRLVSFEASSTYHLIYAYLLENTRILQIFERLIDKYLTGEELGIANDNRVVTWIHNGEDLFFKNSIRSEIRRSADSTRRNAYWRMFGMDLAFGDINSESNSIQYHKAKTSNQQFIVLFEKYLAEVWRGYINARNSSGENTTDINVIRDLAIQLQELLIARRGVFNLSYSNQNLSREEFYSVLITSWFTFIISHNSVVVDFLNCHSSTIGERLLKIGAKVGVPAHSKCQYLFEMAGAASNILTTVEAGGFLDNANNIQIILSALNPPPAVPPPQVFINFMQDFLTVINNWEKATGHNIKNPETRLGGTLKVEQKAARPVLTTN